LSLYIGENKLVVVACRMLRALALWHTYERCRCALSVCQYCRRGGGCVSIEAAHTHSLQRPVCLSASVASRKSIVQFGKVLRQTDLWGLRERLMLHREYTCSVYRTHRQQRTTRYSLWVTLNNALWLSG